jgi:hypothetical protein
VPIRVEPGPQTIGWFKDRLAEECLVFKPPFQRNPVWLEKHKAYLIDTVLRGLPVPEIYIQKETDEDGKAVYSIVDGQQRIRALLEFGRGRVELMEEYTPGRDGHSWENMSGDERRAFWNYRLLTREIEGASDADLRDLFRRLNQHSITLNAQEIRNARYKGDFIETVTSLADEQYWAEHRIVSANEIRRMLDIEYMAELLVGIMHGPQNKKSTLDVMFESYEGGIPQKQYWLARFEATRGEIAAILPEIGQTRWRGKSDYYSLFLAVDALQQAGSLSAARRKLVRKALVEFGAQVSARLAKEGRRSGISRAVSRYATAVEKAASDKDRREARHRILLDLIGRQFR